MEYCLNNIERIVTRSGSDAVKEDYLRIPGSNQSWPHLVANERKIWVRKSFPYDEISIAMKTILVVLFLENYIDSNFSQQVWQKNLTSLLLQLTTLNRKRKRYVIILTDLKYEEKVWLKDQITKYLTGEVNNCTRIFYENIQERESLAPAFEALKMFSSKLMAVE